MRVLAACLLVLIGGCADRCPQTVKEAPASPDEAYLNPVDKKTYLAPGGWKTYLPETPRPDEPGRKVRTQHVRLLSSQSDIETRTTVADLAAFIREAERLADESFGKSGRRFQVMAQFHCQPTGHEVKLAHQGDATQELLQEYYDALTAAKKLRVKDGEVSFQLELSVSP
jgi:hypothetical protein